MESWDWLGDRIASAEEPTHIKCELVTMLSGLAGLAILTHLTADQELQVASLPPDIAAVLAQADRQTLLALIFDAITLLAQSDLD